MIDATLNKLVQLIAAHDAPELRQAAIRVAGSIGPAQHKPLVQVLLQALADPAVELRREAIRAAGLLRLEESLPHLESFARLGGEELEAAVQAASQLGAKGSKVMGRVMEQVTPPVRSRIASVLARSGTGNALVVTAQTLLDADPKVVENAARSLASEVPNFTTSQKHSLAKFLTDNLQGKQPHTPATEAAMLRVLGALHDVRSEEVFWSRLITGRPRDIRVAALRALGNLGAQLTDARMQKLLGCAADRDFQIVSSALMLLKDVPANRKNLKPWLQLLQAPDVAARRFAVAKLRGVETPDVAQALVPQMDHPDRGLREEVQQILGSFAAGRDALLEKLLAAGTVEEAWSLARALAPRFAEIAGAQAARVFAEACEYQEKEDRRAAPLWFFLRELEPRWTRDQVEERAKGWRKKKKFVAALIYYRLLAQDPACSEDIRFELAATGLKTSGHDLALDARQNDSALNQFARLLQDAGFDLLERVTKATWLDPEDLFYLGFHFVEQKHRARDFGKHVLELVVQRTPKSDLGKNAKRKLKSEAADN